MPSFTLLYSMDDWEQPDLTLKIIGNQWFWTYEYSDYIFTFWNKYKGSFEYDSYMLLEKELYWGELRLLEVDNRICIPLYTNIRLLITSSDVLHCWTIPSLGVKLDACPGRLNQTFFFTNRRGVFYGQCSEICGINHGFMPIVLESVNIRKYLRFLKSFNIF
jgi:cytochrome c oxidase subunit 2